MSVPGTTRISLAPTPGFCIKSATLNQTTVALPPAASDNAPSSSAATTIAANLKVFVNIAWDKNVPAPPQRSEDAIERAVAGDVSLDASDPEDWFVPVIVSEPRRDNDKAGKPSIVFDCIFSAALKSRALRSPEFKTFLIELSFQRIEAQWGVQLARQIGTPNIASKGKLLPRSVLVPSALLSPAQADLSPAPAAVVGAEAGKGARPLIEEVGAGAGAATPTPKGILKSPPPRGEVERPLVPGLSWTKAGDGRLRIVLSAPRIARAATPSTTLDLEPRRLIFAAPSITDTTTTGDADTDTDSPAYALDLDLDRADAEIEALFDGVRRDAKGKGKGEGEGKSAREALMLKRERAFDVDAAVAEWRVAEGVLVVYA
ncbi:pre-RNA processing PIH1/Nop17-domain-containing protein [Trametes maxima]|nr:pre-RNA processing PIH1/Nop17-domain-containing protein [Trametes maxima]